MTRLLALDCSTQIGWALFAQHDAKPQLGTWPLPRAAYHDELGRVLLAFEEWLAGKIMQSKPSVLAFESPILPFFETGEQHSNGLVVRLLIGLATMAEVTGVRNGLHCIEVPVPTAKKRLAGSRYAKKRDMIAGAHRLGWIVETDHEADAIAVALCAYDHLRGVT